MRNISLGVFLAVTIAGSSSSRATLIGDQVSARWEALAHADYPFDFSDDFTVGDGPEGEWTSVLRSSILDISGSSISVDNTIGIGLSENIVWTFSSLDWQGPASRLAEVQVSTNWSRWDDSFVEFGDDFVRITFLNDVSFDNETDYWNADLVFTPVPEPPSQHLVLVAMMAVCLRLRSSFNRQSRRPRQ